MRTIIWLLYAVVYFIRRYPKQRYYEKKKEAGTLSREERRNLHIDVQNWAGSMLKIAGVTYEVSGRENIPEGEAVLFTPNHQGNFDIMLLIHALGEISLVAKIELAKVPFVSNWMRLIDCVFLDRGNPREAIKTFGQAEAVIKNGKSVVIFPEGTRSKGGPVQEFKDGAFKIAQKSHAPIVPIVIDGSYKALEEHGIWIRPCHVKLKILPPINMEDLETEERKHIGALVQKEIEKHLM